MLINKDSHIAVDNVTLIAVRMFSAEQISPDNSETQSFSAFSLSSSSLNMSLLPVCYFSLDFRGARNSFLCWKRRPQRSMQFEPAIENANGGSVTRFFVSKVKVGRWNHPYRNLIPLHPHQRLDVFFALTSKQFAAVFSPRNCHMSTSACERYSVSLLFVGITDLICSYQSPKPG